MFITFILDRDWNFAAIIILIKIPSLCHLVKQYQIFYSFWNQRWFGFQMEKSQASEFYKFFNNVI